MKKSRFIKLGILLVACIAILIWGINYLKGHDIFRSVSYYFAVYDRVDGLTESGEITYNGYKLGSVKSIKFLPDGSGRLVVTLMIDDGIKIPKNSQARIVGSLMGGSSVELITGDSDRFCESGDTLQGSTEAGLMEMLMPLKNKAESLIGHLDTVMVVLNSIFDDNMQQNLSESFANINRSTANIERASSELSGLLVSEKQSIAGLLNNMEAFSDALAQNADNFENIIGNLSAVSDSLNAIPFTPIFTGLSSSLQELGDLLKSAGSDQSSLGLLLTNPDLYNNLTYSLAALDRLLIDVRENPKKYVHFSAVDMGRTINVNTSGSIGENENPSIIFKIHLISASTQIPANSPIFSGLVNVEECNENNMFSYYTGNFQDYAEADQLLKKVYALFPNATIAAFKNGRSIKLEKAIKQLK